jgi:hypothetical protein
MAAMSQTHLIGIANTCVRQSAVQLHLDRKET